MDASGAALRWRSPTFRALDKQYKCLVAFALVSRVQSGCATVAFSRAKSKSGSGSGSSNVVAQAVAASPERCFSLLHKAESLDLLAPTAADAQQWVL